jgi:hypothetical protein
MQARPRTAEGQFPPAASNNSLSSDGTVTAVPGNNRTKKLVPAN